MKTNNYTRTNLFSGGELSGQKDLKKFAIAIFFLLFLAVSPQMFAQDPMAHGESNQVVSIQPDLIDWQDGPPSLEAGAQFSVLEGNPSEEGYFNLRLKLPDGFQISPHWHPNIERITVISGNFLLGHGEDVDREFMEHYGPGSYISLPPEMVHYAIAEGETIVQLSTTGPWKINYVNEKDDPRKR